MLHTSRCNTEQTNGVDSPSIRLRTMVHVPWYQWYHGTYSIKVVRTCTRTNIYLSQKRLEIQALRCNGETRGRSIKDITVSYGSNSTAMSTARISTTILASMWACTRTSACIACIASLRTVSAYAGSFHGWSSWLGTCSPGSGAVRASSQSRAALLTRPPVCRINGMKLSWSYHVYCTYHGTVVLSLATRTGSYAVVHCTS
jgi:hypothetical protein